MEKIKDMLAGAGGNIVLAIVVLIVGHFLIKWIMKVLRKLKGFEKLDQTMTRFVLNFIKWLLYVMLIVGVIGILGVPMAQVIAVLASAGVAVGLALQGALSNLAGGILLMILRPFNVGDYVDAAGASGVVHSINLFYTVITTIDNKRITVPNGSLMNSNVTDYTAEPLRRVDLVFSCAKSGDPAVHPGRRSRQPVRAAGSGSLRPHQRRHQRVHGVHGARLVQDRELLGPVLRAEPEHRGGLRGQGRTGARAARAQRKGLISIERVMNSGCLRRQPLFYSLMPSQERASNAEACFLKKS